MYIEKIENYDLKSYCSQIDHSVYAVGKNFSLVGCSELVGGSTHNYMILLLYIFRSLIHVYENENTIPAEGSLNHCYCVY